MGRHDIELLHLQAGQCMPVLTLQMHIDQLSAFVTDSFVPDEHTYLVQFLPDTTLIYTDQVVSQCELLLLYHDMQVACVVFQVE